MCLGIPGKVVDIDDSGALRMGRIDFGGVRKEACLAYLPEVGLGDYVIVHVGFAISQVDEDEALRTIELLRMLEPEGVDQELEAMGDPDGPGPMDAGRSVDVEGARPGEIGRTGEPVSAGWSEWTMDELVAVPAPGDGREPERPA